MTEDEAEKLFCPFVRPELVPGEPFMGKPLCISSSCMAWRWNIQPFDAKETWSGREEPGSGYCGLAGKP